MTCAHDRGGRVGSGEEGACAGEFRWFLIFAEKTGGDFGVAVCAVFPSHVDGRSLVSSGGEVHGELGSEGEDGLIVVIESLDFDFGREA